MPPLLLECGVVRRVRTIEIAVQLTSAGRGWGQHQRPSGRASGGGGEGDQVEIARVLVCRGRGTRSKQELFKV
jgi:hypothetical protein